MSTIESLLNQISTKELGGITKPQGFDLNDDTFEKLLQKGLDATKVEPQNTVALNLGAPAGMIIEPFSPSQINNNAPIQPVQEVNEPFEIKDVDIGSDYFSNLLHKSPNEHKSILSYAKKHAAGAYNVFGKGLVQDLADFASDVVGMLK